MTHSLSKLSDIHDRLCHPGVTRLRHFVRTKNLPYSTDNVMKLCHSCRICAELKPHFYLPQQNTLIKATQPMERWSIDFKGPLRSSSQNTYMFTIVDEYSRFPFAFPCPNTTSATVIFFFSCRYITLLSSTASHISAQCHCISAGHQLYTLVAGVGSLASVPLYVVPLYNRMWCHHHSTPICSYCICIFQLSFSVC